MKHLLLFTLLALSALPLSAHAERKLQVVASFSIIGDMVKQVAGGDVELKTLVGADGDVHEYEPTPTDARILANADIIFINGLGLEGWMERLIKSSGYKGEVVVLTKGIRAIKTRGHDDPHAWQDPQNAAIYIANIRDALIAADAGNAGRYKAAATSYTSKLTTLDAWAQSEISEVASARRNVISQHDSFEYFSARYGVKFIAPLGISTDSQPSAADMAKIIDQIRRQNITAVFLENMSDPHLMKQLETDAGAHIGGTLYSDALSPPDGPAPDYITLFRHNVVELVAAMKKNPLP